MTSAPADHDTEIESSRMQTLAKQLDTGDQAVLDRFWLEMAEVGTPIIEPTADDPTDCLVTFVWRETQPVTGVSISEQFSYTDADRRRLTKLPGSDVWYLSWHIRSTLRGSYEFKLFHEDGSETIVHDPLNHHLHPDDWQYVETREELKPTAILVLPDARELRWQEQREDVATGTLTEHQFESAILGNSRKLWVYTPAGFDRDKGPYPYVLMFDGQKFHSAPTVLDNLIAAGAIPPVVCILVDQIEIRNHELTCNPEFSRALVEELVPWARDAYNLSDRPDEAVITGRSFGGLCSAFTALHYPEVFGNVLMQSGSCWYEPVALEDYRRNPVQTIIGNTYQTPTLILEYLNAEPVPIRIYQEVGSQELGPPPAHPLQIDANRHFRDVVTAKGYDLHYVEFNGGHDDAWWRGTLADGLIHLIGS